MLLENFREIARRGKADKQAYFRNRLVARAQQLFGPRKADVIQVCRERDSHFLLEQGGKVGAVYTHMLRQFCQCDIFLIIGSHIGNYFADNGRAAGIVLLRHG